MGPWLIIGLGSPGSGAAPQNVGWPGRLRHTKKELEEKLRRQRANTFGRRWFEDYLAAQARALEKAEKAKSAKQREALEEAVEAADEAVDAAIEQGREVHDLTVALNAAASASRLTASIKHARNVVVLASTYEDDNDEETVELLLLH
jgi:membrane glycosyltransferase